MRALLVGDERLARREPLGLFSAHPEIEIVSEPRKGSLEGGHEVILSRRRARDFCERMSVQPEENPWNRP